MQISIDGPQAMKQFRASTAELRALDNKEQDSDPRDGFVRTQKGDEEWFYQADHPSQALGESVERVSTLEGPEMKYTMSEVAAKSWVGKMPDRHGDSGESIIANPGDLYLTIDAFGEHNEFLVYRETEEAVKVPS